PGALRVGNDLQPGGRTLLHVGVVALWVLAVVPVGRRRGSRWSVSIDRRRVAVGRVAVDGWRKGVPGGSPPPHGRPPEAWSPPEAWAKEAMGAMREAMRTTREAMRTMGEVMGAVRGSDRRAWGPAVPVTLGVARRCAAEEHEDGDEDDADA